MLLKKVLITCMALLAAVGVVSAKDYSVTIQSNPEGAKVYLNEQLVCTSTPAIISLPKKTVTKAMIFRFEKEGYETKSVIVQYTKDQLKYNPSVQADLKKVAPERPTGAYDPTVTDNQALQRVDRRHGGETDMEATILRWYFDSDPRGARIFYRVISNVPQEVKNTNEAYLTTTPFEETRGFNIPGLTYQNARNVTIEFKITKRGYEDQVKRFNVRQAIDQQEISGFFELVPKETGKPDKAVEADDE